MVALGARVTSGCGPWLLCRPRQAVEHWGRMTLEQLVLEEPAATEGKDNESE
jgi:hypothetical protein